MPAQNANGWLPYGSTDESVLLQHPLTSDPLSYLATKGTASVSGSGLQTFDAVKGMCPNGSGGFYLQNLLGLANLDHAGQITFEVERDFVCTNDPSRYTFGMYPATFEAILSIVDSLGIQNYFGVKFSTGLFRMLLSSTQVNVNLSSAGKGPFVKVNFGWSGGRVGGKQWMAIDGVIVGEGIRNHAASSGLFTKIYIGSYYHTVGNFPTQHFFRNLQISSNAPMFASSASCLNIGIISDSMMDTYGATGTAYDTVSSSTIKRALNNVGLFPAFTTSLEGGSRMDNSHDGGTVRYLHTQLAAMLLKNPDIVIIRGATNDPTNSRCSTAGWKAAVAQYVTTCLNTPSVKQVYFLGIPSYVGNTATNTETAKAERIIGEQKIKEVCDDWRAANPADPRKVIFVSDMYNLLGGENPPPGTFIGQVAGTYADIHFSGYGHYLHGKAIADAIIDNLS